MCIRRYKFILRFSTISILSGLVLIVNAWFFQPEARHWKNEVQTISEQKDAKLFYKRVIPAEQQWATINYGLSLCTLGILLVVIQHKGFKNVTNPDSAVKVSLVALAAIATSLIAFYLTHYLKIALLLQPPWRDYTKEFADDFRQLVIFYGVWTAIHFTAFAGPFNYRFRFVDLSLSYINIFYLTTTVLSAGFAIICFIGGEVLYFIAALFWLYFHLSILAGKRSSIPMER